MSEYQFNEFQLKWLEALESGNYQQAKGLLHDGKGYCCLGVACALAGIPVRPIGDHFQFQDKTKTAPASVVAQLRLRGAEAELEDEADIGGVVAENLTYPNDNGASFKEIAAFIRANPEKVFLP